jgi:hypothetical protein
MLVGEVTRIQADPHPEFLQNKNLFSVLICGDPPVLGVDDADAANLFTDDLGDIVPSSLGGVAFEHKRIARPQKGHEGVDVPGPVDEHGTVFPG